MDQLLNSSYWGKEINMIKKVKFEAVIFKCLFGLTDKLTDHQIPDNLHQKTDSQTFGIVEQPRSKKSRLKSIVPDKQMTQLKVRDILYYLQTDIVDL